MIEPEYYPDIEDVDDLKLYIEGALKLVHEAAHYAYHRDDLYSVWSYLDDAEDGLKAARDVLKKVTEDDR